MTIRILSAVFIVFLVSGSGFLLYDYNSFAEQYTNVQMEILRNRSRLKDLEKQIGDVRLEHSLVGRRLTPVCAREYLGGRKTLLLLATSQDCSPCTEKELQIWKEFLTDTKIGIPMLCLYYRFNKSQYGKYEDVYGSIFPFAYDEHGLYEDLGVNDTPIILLVDGDGTILLAHRPDVLREEKTNQFLAMLVRMFEHVSL